MLIATHSVIQRQLWLMENSEPKLTKEEAYDIARHEFYELRQQEDIGRRIAIEEARMVGAYFGKNTLQVGMDLEDKEYERWKGWAAKEVAAKEAQRAERYSSVVDTPAEDPELLESQ